MKQGEILEIIYERVVEVERIVLTESNCEKYGYLSTQTSIKGQTYIVFYKKEDSPENFIQPEISNGVATTTINNNITKTFSHIAPPCSEYKISFADVDKEGSGRNSLTGEMFRERIGSYSMLNIAWNLIPNSKEYNNWYKILTHLPKKVTLRMLTPSGEIQNKEYYRGDISTDLYLFLDKENQIWNGLSTTFTQWEIDPYDDGFEPVKKYLIKDTKSSNIKKTIYEYELEKYIEEGWTLEKEV